MLLVLAAFRLWRLIAEDTIIDRPRAWLLRGDLIGHETPPPEYREELSKFLLCPWCLGFWLCVAWWLGWLAFGDWALLAATPWAMSAVVGPLGARFG
jgi:hypothetical protein